MEAAMTAARRNTKRIKRSRYNTDDEFVKALRAANKNKQAEQYIARKEKAARK